MTTWGRISGGPINVWTWGSLYPYNYVTNFGGQTQLNTLPLNTPYADAIAFQNAGNPWISGLNYLNACQNMFMPDYTQMYLGQMAYNQGYDMATRAGNNTTYRFTMSDITSLKNQLTQVISSGKLTDAEKAELNEYKKQAEALERRLQEIAEMQNQGASSQQVSTALNEVSKEVANLKDKVKTAADRILEAVRNRENTQGTENGDDSGSDDADGSSDSEVDGFDENGRPTGLGDAPSSKEVREWAQNFNSAVYYFWGTDDDVFVQTLNQIDASNIVEYVDYYDKHFSGKGFFYDFLEDAEHSQKTEFVPKILEALQARAELLGISEDIIDDVKMVNDQLNDWVINNDDVANGLKGILEKIQQAESARSHQNS